MNNTSSPEAACGPASHAEFATTSPDTQRANADGNPSPPPPAIGKPPNPLLDRLTPPQHIAFAAITAGESYEAAAELAGVTRGTVAHWRSSDANFFAAMEDWHVRTRKEIHQRMMELALSIRADFAREKTAAPGKRQRKRGS